MSEYAATYDMEEAPYVPSRGEYKLDSGYSVRQYVPVYLGTQDTDEPSSKYWVLPYDDYDGITGAVGVTLENRFKTGYIDYDIYGIAAGIGGYAPDIRLAIHGGPVPMLNWCAAPTTGNQIVAPHPSGFTDWSVGKAKLGKVMEQAAPTGEQCYIWLDMEKAQHAPIIDVVTSPVVTGDDPLFNLGSGVYTEILSVFDVTNQIMLSEGDPTATTYTFSGYGTGIIVREENSITGLVVTYRV